MSFVANHNDSACCVPSQDAEETPENFFFPPCSLIELVLLFSLFRTN